MLRPQQRSLETSETARSAAGVGAGPAGLLRPLRSLPRMVRAIWRTRKMTAKWPFFEYAQFLDTPLVTLRRRFNIVPL